MAHGTNELIFKLDDDDLEGELLAFVRRELRFMVDYQRRSQVSIADAAGVSQATVHNLLNGKVQHPQVRTVFPVLAMCDLEFDASRGAIVRRSAEVVPLRA